MTEPTPLKFSYALLRRSPEGIVKTLKIHQDYRAAINQRDYLRGLAKRKESRALFYVKMIVQENQDASA